MKGGSPNFCEQDQELSKKRRRRYSSRPSPQTSQVPKKPNLDLSGPDSHDSSSTSDVCSDSDRNIPNMSETVNISENDIAKIALAVKQMIISEVNSIVEEKQKPIWDEIKQIKEKQDVLEFQKNEEIKQLKFELDYLTTRNDELEQHSRKQCIRFSGVRAFSSENTDQIVLDIVNKLCVYMQASDLLVSHRTGRNKPRQIIARIPNHNLKKNILKASKLIPGKPEHNGISINQDLTRTRSGLAYQARQLVRDKKVKST